MPGALSLTGLLEAAAARWLSRPAPGSGSGGVEQRRGGAGLSELLQSVHQPAPGQRRAAERSLVAVPAVVGEMNGRGLPGRLERPHHLGYGPVRRGPPHRTTPPYTFVIRVHPLLALQYSRLLHN